MRWLKKWYSIVLICMLLLHGIFLLTNKTYVYAAVWYNFADIDDHKIFENRVIKAGDHQPWPMGKNYNQLKLTATLENKLKEIQTVAFLVIKRDSIRHEAYWNGYTEGSMSNSFSMAKSIVSILIGIAIDEQYIKSLDQPVGAFLPAFRENGKSRITVKHLLTMTSGLNWQETYISPVSHTTEAYYGHDLEYLVARLKPVEAPGTKFEYKSGDTQILGFILQKAVGKTISEYASEKLWRPIGSENDALWSLDHENGMEKSYCCFNANARDFARIGYLYMNGGRWNGRQVISENYVKQSVQPLRINDKTINYYGYSWWLLPHPDHKIFYARGILGQYIIVIPDEELIIVRLGKRRGKLVGKHFEEVPLMVEEVIGMFKS